MILNAYAQNYHSFKKRNAVHFMHQKVSAPESFIELKQDAFVNKVAVFYGANASGKTNLLRAIACIRYFIVESYNTDVDKENPLFPFQFCSEVDDQVCLGIEFWHQNKRKKYEIVVSRAEIIEEKLYEGEILVLQREKNSVSVNTFFEANISVQLRKNVSVIAHLIQSGSKKGESLWRYFQALRVNVTLDGRQGITDRMISDASKVYKEQEEIRTFLNTMLKKFDTGITKIHKFQPVQVQFQGMVLKEPLLFPLFHHESERYIPFGLESEGTIALYCYVEKIYFALKEGSVLIMDELEKDLHPDVVREIVELFRNPEKNPHNAQLIASTHSTPLLKELEREEVFFVEKKRNESEVFALTDFAPEDTQRIFEMYEGGRYGAVPDIEPLYPFS